MRQTVIIKKPGMAMSFELMSPASNIIAFGGDATGRTNAYEQESVNGTMTVSGFTPIDLATFSTTPRRMVAVVALEATSVRTKAMAQVTTCTPKSGTPWSKLLSMFPRMKERPEALAPAERAKPPPSRRTTFQAIFDWVAFHVIRVGEVASCIGFTGIIK